MPTTTTMQLLFRTMEVRGAKATTRTTNVYEEYAIKDKNFTTKDKNTNACERVMFEPINTS